MTIDFSEGKRSSSYSSGAHSETLATILTHDGNDDESE